MSFLTLKYGEGGGVLDGSVASPTSSIAGAARTHESSRTGYLMVDEKKNAETADWPTRASITDRKLTLG
jgi:hypothetical protein